MIPKGCTIYQLKICVRWYYQFNCARLESLNSGKHMISGSSRKEKEVGPVGGTDSHAFVTCENVLTVKVSTAPFESRMGSQAVAIPEQNAVGVLD